MRIKGILGVGEGQNLWGEVKWHTVLIGGIIRGFNGVVCLSYFLPVLLQPLKIVFATLA